MNVTCDKCTYAFTTGSISTECPQCGELLRVRNEHLAKRIPERPRKNSPALPLIVAGAVIALSLVYFAISFATDTAPRASNDERESLLMDFVNAKTELDPRILTGKTANNAIYLVVDQTWHLVPKQLRLQNAQNIVQEARTATGDDDVIVSFVDVNGNEVAGSSAWSGAWVQD